MCHWCSYHIFTSSMIYYWTDARHHGIYLFYIITKSPFYFKIFQHIVKAGLCPALAKTKKKAMWRDLLSTYGCGQPRGHLIRVLNERSVNKWDFCLLWLVILKSVWYSVGDTFKLRYCQLWAVVSYTSLAAVPWNGQEHLHRKAR